MKPTVAVAGASGFIGRWFIEQYSDTYNFIALSRGEMEGPFKAGVEWRQVDLYSLSSTIKALEGADYALYLVHSMQPSTRLSQGSFEDTDILLADNFSRASEAVGLKQIIFMGGILPKESSDISTHLRSRYEVEQTLGSRKTPLTALRAGIVVGPGGSSYEIIEKLVSRLPVMLCPKWTRSDTQPISLTDTLKIIDYCLGNGKAYGEAIEIGGEVTNYMEMLQTTAQLMNKNCIIRSVPVFSLGLSKLWVAVFSDNSTTFVSPLIESLRHTMTVDEHPLIKEMGISYMRFEDAVTYTMEHKGNLPALPKRKSGQTTKNTVRSVQRLSNPSAKSAEWVAKAYMNWLPRSFKYLIKLGEQEEFVSFNLFGVRLLELQFVEDKSDDQRQLFYIVGGLLAKRSNFGWLEFRSALEGRIIISAVHEFVPRLPWFVYINTQALVHVWVMNRFGRYLKKSI